MENHNTLSNEENVPQINLKVIKKAISLIQKPNQPILKEIATKNGQVFIEKLQELDMLDEIHQRNYWGSLYFGLPLIEDEDIPAGEVHMKDSNGNTVKKFII